METTQSCRNTTLSHCQWSINCMCTSRKFNLNNVVSSCSDIPRQCILLTHGDSIHQWSYIKTRWVLSRTEDVKGGRGFTLLPGRTPQSQDWPWIAYWWLHSSPNFRCSFSSPSWDHPKTEINGHNNQHRINTVTRNHNNHWGFTYKILREANLTRSSAAGTPCPAARWCSQGPASVSGRRSPRTSSPSPAAPAPPPRPWPSPPQPGFPSALFSMSQTPPPSSTASPPSSRDDPVRRSPRKQGRASGGAAEQPGGGGGGGVRDFEAEAVAASTRRSWAAAAPGTMGHTETFEAQLVGNCLQYERCCLVCFAPPDGLVPPRLFSSMRRSREL